MGVAPKDAVVFRPVPSRFKTILLAAPALRQRPKQRRHLASLGLVPSSPSLRSEGFYVVEDGDSKLSRILAHPGKTLSDRKKIFDEIFFGATGGFMESPRFAFAERLWRGRARVRFF